MARGKYKNSAEARQAREGALSEVEAGRRTIVRLTSENKELRQALIAEKATNSKRLRELNAMLAEGTSPEVEALRLELATAREAASNAEIGLARRLLPVLRTNEVSQAALGAILAALGLTPAEFFGTAQTGTRRERRYSAQRMAESQNVRRQLRNPGAQVAPVQVQKGAVG